MHSTRSERTPASLFALVFGGIYLIVGLYGFTATGLHGFADEHGPRLLGVFMINPLHNIIHLVLATVWLAGSFSHRTAKLANLFLGGLLGLVTVLGVLRVLTFLGIHSIADPDNFLHLATAMLSLYFGSLGADRLSSVKARELA